MKALQTVAFLALAGGAAYWAYGKWFKKTSTGAGTATVVGTIVRRAPGPPIQGLSGSKLSVF